MVRVVAWDAIDVSCEEFDRRDRVAQEFDRVVVKTFRVERSVAARRILACSFARATVARMAAATPTGRAITVPQVRALLASSLHRKLDCDHPEIIARKATRRLQRNEIARFYHWKKRKRLAPKRIHQRR